MAPELVEHYALVRAAELTQANGFDWFRIVARDLAHEERGGVGIGAGVGTGSYGRRSGIGVGVGGSVANVGGRDFYTARIEFLMGAHRQLQFLYMTQHVLRNHRHAMQHQYVFLDYDHR